LYIDTLETVFSNATKVMMDVEGGNNMMFLPLDKLIDNTAMSRGGSQANVDMRALTDKVVEQLRRDTQTTRREGR
jgi:membrane protease subunit HflK